MKPGTQLTSNWYLTKRKGCSSINVSLWGWLFFPEHLQTGYYECIHPPDILIKITLRFVDLSCYNYRMAALSAGRRRQASQCAAHTKPCFLSRLSSESLMQNWYNRSSTAAAVLVARTQDKYARRAVCTVCAVCFERVLAVAGTPQRAVDGLGVATEGPGPSRCWAPPPCRGGWVIGTLSSPGYTEPWSRLSHSLTPSCSGWFGDRRENGGVSGVGEWVDWGRVD